jgi:uncharacterized repeat protein (TIGR03803 family)
MVGTALAALVMMPAVSEASVLSTLYNFRGMGAADGSSPTGLVLGPNGVLYGATYQGGRGFGTIYQLTEISPGVWTETMLYEFAGGVDGSSPKGCLALASDGTLYGTTAGGGVAGKGTVYELSPPATEGGAWTHTVLYSFTGSNGDGATPYAGVTIGSNGSLYGTTVSGGAAGYGTVYQISQGDMSGNGFAETVLYSFDKQKGDGVAPYGGVVMGASGALFGTTHAGGYKGKGTVYMLSPPAVAGDPWTETLLHSFATKTGDGAAPYAGVVINPRGVLFGTTYGGGPLGLGTVYSLTPPSASNGSWVETILYQFTGQGTDGAEPYSGVLIGPGGMLFGTTNFGGGLGSGAVYTLTPPATRGQPWTENTVYGFSGGMDGGLPNNLVFGASGMVFGTTVMGGFPGYGTIFQLSQ